ncbi:MAG: hypothetical protein ACI9LM_003332 [Alteromonadaceae bacterium]|jgi:hypothetical protein
MRTALEKTLRKKLEDTVVKARDIVEIAVNEALIRLGISEGSAPGYLSEEERKLRNRLRVHGRQLGGSLHKESGKQEIELLINEMAYEHWHRMLFARFLEQSDLLMYEPGTPVTLDECFELAEEESDVKDGWELAGRLAQKMLPQIFRADSPVFEVKLSINHVDALEELIAALNPDTFQASDSLGWCYQFWQNKMKKQVNESGVIIGAKELSPVTQLFTEPYMVSFLLDNALGAWWAKCRLTQDDLQTATSEQELRDLASIPGVPLEYLRFVQDEETKVWSNAAGDFDKWPEHLSELKTLDPCCGSGHFLVAKFLMLVPMRMQLEALTAKQAVDKVIAENIHGLELDQRCVELAAFALALEAWRYPGAGGYRQLPELQLACSGMSITEAQKEWKDLAKDDENLQGAVKWMQETFRHAPTLGSLIGISNEDDKNHSILKKVTSDPKALSEESRISVRGLIKTAELLSYKYSLVTTNVPYLGIRKQNSTIRKFCEDYYPEAKHDLATVFIQRLLKLLSSGGTSLIVSPNLWMFLSSYTNFRKMLINNSGIDFICNLGEGGFESGSAAGAFVSLASISNIKADEFVTALIDTDSSKNIVQKKHDMKSKKILYIPQKEQLKNPDSKILFQIMDDCTLFEEFADSVAGILNGDSPRFIRDFWTIKDRSNLWWPIHNSPEKTQPYSGMNSLILYDRENGHLREIKEVRRDRHHGADERGRNVWGRRGVLVSRMRYLASTFYTGDLYDQNAAVIVPKSDSHLLAVIAYCSSKEFHQNVRKIDTKINVTNATLTKIPFEIDFWSQRGLELYPNGLPLPYSDVPTQWIFHGHPCASVSWNEETKSTSIGDLRQDDAVLQVAIARLLGYRWPAEFDTEMELAPEMREVLAKCKDFDGLVDDDGIVCIPAIRGEKPANDRLEAILHAAYGDEWSATVLNKLLKSVNATNLTTWLRDKFFEQHSKLFQHRPFIWQVWDGLADGFSALVNYQILDYKGLERLIYTYLDDWISTQIQLEKDGNEGAELRLSAARNLKESLESILKGESGLDIFVRWKPLAEQAIGWNPDLNDGVRLNIRPFMQAKDVGKKDAGVLRSKPNIHWKKDRGTDVASAPWFDLGLEYGGKQGDRINDHHLTLAEKKAAREEANEQN